MEAMLRASHLVLAVALLAPMSARGDALDEVRVRETEVRTADAQRAQLDARRAQLDHEAQALAGDVERIKADAPGVRRDLRLGELLATSRAKADELDHVATELRARQSQLASARRGLVSACDRALGRAQIAEAQRLQLERLRTAQVTLLAQPAQPLELGHAAADPLDGPRELEEKADLLRDSQDKLRREAERLSSRIDDVERRRHLRERASAVDEDWFGESASNRKTASVAKSVGTNSLGGRNSNDATQGAGSPNTPAPAAGGGGAFNGDNSGGKTNTPGGLTNSGGEFRTDTTTTLRNLVDPATLDELRRTDGGDDLERQVRALRRAQGELEGLARDLDRRARALAQRADELKHKK
jgi:hypothetical protein